MKSLFLHCDHDICDEFVGAQIYCRSILLTSVLLINEVAVAQRFCFESAGCAYNDLV